MSDKSNLILLSGGDDEGSRGEDEVPGQPRVQRPDQEEPKPAHRAALLVNVQNYIYKAIYVCEEKIKIYIYICAKCEIIYKQSYKWIYLIIG